MLICGIVFWCVGSIKQSIRVI